MRWISVSRRRSRSCRELHSLSLSNNASRADPLLQASLGGPLHLQVAHLLLQLHPHPAHLRHPLLLLHTAAQSIRLQPLLALLGLQLADGLLLLAAVAQGLLARLPGRPQLVLQGRHLLLLLTHRRRQTDKQTDRQTSGDVCFKGLHRECDYNTPQWQEMTPFINKEEIWRRNA
ncbi:hypothetical protein CRUP_001629, partial [Coryphaenoides rupestris]